MDFQMYLAQWSKLHGNAIPSKLVRVWLRLAFVLSTPFLRVNPNLITAASVVILAGLVPLVSASSTWFALAALGIFLVGLLDSFDGMVAVRSGKVSTWGAYLDAIADRIVDVLIGLLLIAAGANSLVVLSAISISLVHEYMRAKAQAVGVHEVGIVSIAEKPTRVILGVMAMSAAAISNFDADVWTTIAGLVWITVGAIGATQVFWKFRKLLKTG